MATREYKQWLKDQKELLELHKRCLKSELFYMGVEPSTRRKFFKLYDMVIRPETIREYFHRPLKIFIEALVRDELDQIRDVYPSPKVRIRRIKHSKRKSK